MVGRHFPFLIEVHLSLNIARKCIFAFYEVSVCTRPRSCCKNPDFEGITHFSYQQKTQHYLGNNSFSMLLYFPNRFPSALSPRDCCYGGITSWGMGTEFASRVSFKQAKDPATDISRGCECDWLWWFTHYFRQQLVQKLFAYIVSHFQ